MPRVNLFPGANSEDTAQYVVPLSKFQRPRLYVVGGGEFEFPLGTEGLRLAGAATLAEHKYVSDNAPAIQVTHRDASTIEMTGVFPGLTGASNVRALKQLLVQVDPPDGKRLELPGILTQAQKVVADSWDFSRAEDSQWDFAYTVNFRIIGVGAAAKGTSPISPAAPTGPKGSTKGQSIHTATVVQGLQTLRMMSFQVYGDPDRWKELYTENKPALSKLYPSAQVASMPTKLLPLGMKLKYAS